VTNVGVTFITWGSSCGRVISVGFGTEVDLIRAGTAICVAYEATPTRVSKRSGYSSASEIDLPQFAVCLRDGGCQPEAAMRSVQLQSVK